GDTYTYLDRRVTANRTYFYRIRQTDLDGTADFSPVVSAKLRSDNEQAWTAYPNPVTDLVTLTGPAGREPVRVSVRDINGRVMPLRADANRTYDLRGLAAGIYLLVLEFSDGERVVVRVVKKYDPGT
ncbi:MAG: T9SS type A sorting domain-containing protein, partial [Saprospiraceae bacterium]